MNGNKPKLIIGLGNPGAQYTGTRHNLGFMMLDAVAEKYGAAWHNKPKFKALLAEITIDGHQAILAKPTTFYNLSGEAAAAIMRFYKLEPADVLVIHDELDLPFGVVRTRLGGSDAGNNGIKSLIQHLGPNFTRARIGIADEHRGLDPVDFVLGKFHTSPELLKKLTASIVDVTALFASAPHAFQASTIQIGEEKST
ncbi:MAG TPA: aminoacyl-tRNA hydrolase [Candidatus Acidoferrum sp.]|nr:aminoacyl-tRNA hydrolase [Candidatus Acidoferrum sp.]